MDDHEDERREVETQKRLAAAREREWRETGYSPTDDELRGTDE